MGNLLNQTWVKIKIRIIVINHGHVKPKTTTVVTEN